MDSRTGPADRDRLTTRRRLLRWGSVGVAASLAGCTADVGDELPPNEKWPVAELTPELPVRERTGVLEDRIRELAGADLADPDAFAAAVEEYDLEVESVETERDVLTLEYHHPGRQAAGVLRDVGLLAGGYAALVEGGFDGVALDVTILETAPDSFGVAEIETRYAERFNAGKLSAAEYGELVASTVETDRDPPDVGVTPGE